MSNSNMSMVSSMDEAKKEERRKAQEAAKKKRDQREAANKRSSQGSQQEDQDTQEELGPPLDKNKDRSNGMITVFSLKFGPTAGDDADQEATPDAEDAEEVPQLEGVEGVSEVIEATKTVTTLKEVAGLWVAAAEAHEDPNEDLEARQARLKEERKKKVAEDMAARIAQRRRNKEISMQAHDSKRSTQKAKMSGMQDTDLEAKEEKKEPKTPKEPREKKEKRKSKKKKNKDDDDDDWEGGDGDDVTNTFLSGVTLLSVDDGDRVYTRKMTGPNCLRSWCLRMLLVCWLLAPQVIVLVTLLGRELGNWDTYCKEGTKHPFACVLPLKSGYTAFILNACIIATCVQLGWRITLIGGPRRDRCDVDVLVSALYVCWLILWFVLDEGFRLGEPTKSSLLILRFYGLFSHFCIFLLTFVKTPGMNPEELFYIWDWEEELAHGDDKDSPKGDVELLNKNEVIV